jgi:hypothetical protein
MAASAVCVLALGALFPATAADTAENPYETIALRNAFALKPPPLPPPPVDPVEKERGKITLMGIDSLFGYPEVLLKVSLAPNPPQPAREQHLILKEGQRDQNIEVLTINEQAGTVRLLNHGEEETLDITKDGVKPPAGGAPAGRVGVAFVPTLPARAGVPIPAGQPPQVGGNGSGASSVAAIGQQVTDALVRNGGNPGSEHTLAFGVQGSSSVDSLPPTEPAYQQMHNSLSSEDQAALIEKHRLELLQAGDPMANMLPNTQYTDEALRAAADGVAAPQGF